MKLVSAIIPHFNEIDNLLICIKHLQDQTYQNIEIIVVDDGSTLDKVKSGLLSAKNLDRVKVIFSNKRNSAHAKNLGYSYAKGDYLLFVDCDHFLNSNFVQLATEALNEENCKIVYADLKMVGHKTGDYQNPNQFSLTDCLFRQPFSGPYLVNRNSLQKFEILFDALIETGIEGQDLCLRLMKNGGFGKNLQSLKNTFYVKKTSLMTQRWTTQMDQHAKDLQNIYLNNSETFRKHIVEFNHNRLELEIKYVDIVVNPRESRLTSMLSPKILYRPIVKFFNFLGAS